MHVIVNNKSINQSIYSLQHYTSRIWSLTNVTCMCNVTVYCDVSSQRSASKLFTSRTYNIFIILFVFLGSLILSSHPDRKENRSFNAFDHK